MAARTRKTATQETNVSDSTVSDNSVSTAVKDAVAPPTAPYTESQDNPSNDKVEGASEIEIPEGATRAHGAAIKRLNAERTRLHKLDARAAKAKAEYDAVQELLNSKRPGLVAAVAAAEVDVDYHTNRQAAVDRALAGAQARAAGHPEDAPDNDGDDDADVIDDLDDAKASPTNAGHVVFE